MGRTPRLIAVAVLVATTASAQHDPYRADIEYDGRFTFVRLRWESDLRLLAARLQLGVEPRLPARRTAPRADPP